MTDQKLLDVDTLYQLGWLEAPTISPDGNWIAYVRVTLDQLANRYRRTIWLAPTAGGAHRRLTNGPRSDTNPRWRPDGQALAFVSVRDGEKPQIYVISMQAGEARQITTTHTGASDPAWSSDGKRIAFVSRLLEDEQASEDQPAPRAAATQFEHQQEQARTAHQEEQRHDPRVVTGLPYRTGTSFKDGRISQIYCVDIPATDEQEVAPARRLTEGAINYSWPVWSHDGLSILAVAERSADHDSLFGFTDIVRIPIPADGRAEPQRLTSPGFVYTNPKPSPDGRWIAAGRHDEHQPLTRGATLVIMPVAGGEPRSLTDACDLNALEYAWSSDSQSLLMLAAWWGVQQVYQVALDGSPVAPAYTQTEARFVAEFAAGPAGMIASVAGTATNPCELYCWTAAAGEQCLSSISARVLDGTWLASFEELNYPAPDGKLVQGWVLYPPGFTPDKRYPLAVHIHGGPHLMWAPGFRAMWHELQVTAARGYITFFCNPRGSDGYGAAWRSGVHTDWGRASQDILAGVDLLCARGHVDTQRIGVAGGSYGGYMTAWLLAHDQRFACGVAARGVYDLVSFHGTSDAFELIEFSFEGRPWEQHERLWQQSPLTHAHNITTPLLILHAELDYRVPIAQAEQLFTNLRRRHIPTELVRYPRDGHELTRSGEPRHRCDHMRRTLEWLDRWTLAKSM